MLEFVDPGLHFALFGLGFVVLSVFRKVTEGESDFDFLRHFGTADGFQLVEFVLQFFQGLVCHLVFVHG